MPGLVRISEAASLALHATACVAEEPDRPFPVREIAAALGVSENHLSKVLQRLAKAGLLHSLRGPAGGFTLGRPAGEITLLQVYEAIEGPLVTSQCLFPRPACDGRNCLLGDLLETASRDLRERLAQTTLGSLQARGFRIPRRSKTDAQGNHPDR